MPERVGRVDVDPARGGGSEGLGLPVGEVEVVAVFEGAADASEEAPGAVIRNRISSPPFLRPFLLGWGA